jgi:hypothetical protein
MNHFENAEEIYGSAVEQGIMPLEVRGIVEAFAGYYETISEAE